MPDTASDTPRPIVRPFFDRPTGSLQYVVHDPDTMAGAIIDPVWNFDARAARTSTTSAEEILAYVKDTGIRVEWVLDTHPHADHFSAAPWLADRLGGVPRGIGAKVADVQKLWRAIYDDPTLPQDGAGWDRLFDDGDSFMLGQIPVRVMLSPGHTLASVTYVIGDAAFVHDTLMMPPSGTSRADFPGGSAAELWRSIRAILDLPGETRLFVGHDYPASGAPPRYMATVAEQRLSNSHVKDGMSEPEFIALREARDATLPLPALMLFALQVNLRGGRLPDAEASGRSFFRIPAQYFDAPKG